jgi:hypothetical protein
MTTSNDQPHVTFQDGCWQGTWQDGYTVIVRAIDMRRVGVCRVELEVRYQNKYVAPFGVDLLDSRSREAFAIAMGARNGVAAVTWDDRLGDFYGQLQEHIATATPATPRSPAAGHATGKTAPVAPPLPHKATIPHTVAEGGAPWLEAYISHSTHWSPRAATGYHCATGLWMLSTIGAHRLAVELGNPLYSNLFIAFISRSTLYAKSTTAKIGRKGLRQAGCGALLAADRATPQALLRSMAGVIPEKFGDMDASDQLAFVERVAFAGQRGWYYEEWGSMLHQMTRKDSPTSEFHGMLRWMDDGEDHFDSETIARGAERATNPYLALLASATPHDLSQFMRPGAAYWHDGFWPRFALVTPLPDEMPSRRRQPTGSAALPSTLLLPLQQWHQALGIPKASIEEVLKNGKPTGRYKAVVESLPCRILTMAPEVLDAYYNYNDALLEMIIDGKVAQDLDACYGRFHVKAIRIAMLLASLAGQPRIALAHWAYAQEVVEQWRVMLHHLVEIVEGNVPLTREETLEDKILRVLDRYGALTARAITKRPPAESWWVQKLSADLTAD